MSVREGSVVDSVVPVHCLPVIDRELRVAARRGAIYKQRFAAAAVAGLVVVCFMFFRQSLAPGAGHSLFAVVAIGGFILSVLEGLRETTDSLSFERREGTLGLLFLTDLRGQHIVFGKLCVASIKSLTTVLSILPVFILPLFLGGVTPGETWRVTLSLVAALIFTMNAGLFVSAISKNALSAIVGTILLVSFGMLFPAASMVIRGPLPEWSGGPFSMFYFAFDATYKTSPVDFVAAAIYSASLSIAMLALACRCAGRLDASDVPNVRSFFYKLVQPTPGYTATWAGKSDPTIWLAEHCLPGRNVLWGLIGIAAVACFLIGCLVKTNVIIILIGVQLFFTFLIKVWIAVLAVQPFYIARRSGALELLLCTPMDRQQLVRAHVDALKAYFIAPTAVACVGLLSLAAMAHTVFVGTEKSIVAGLACFGGGLSFASFLLDLHALAYVGLLSGLGESHLPQAVAKTVVKVLLLPWLFLVFPYIGLSAFFFVPWCFMGWGRKKLGQRLQQEIVPPKHADAVAV